MTHAVTTSSIDRTDAPCVAILNRYEHAVARRAPWVPLWQECYTYTLPEHDRFSLGADLAPTRARDKLFDGTAPDAVDQLAASLLGQLTPPWVNWFGVTPGFGLSDAARHDLQQAAAMTTQVMQETIDTSNLLVELHQCFLDLVVAGTACIQILAQPIGAPTLIGARAVPLAEIVVDDSGTGRLDRIYRKRRVVQADMLPLVAAHPDLADAMAAAPADRCFDILEFCEQQTSGCHTGLIYIPDHGAPVMLRQARPERAPFIAWRWMKMPGEALGRSPVMKALPDIKTANKVVELILKNASIAVTGIWQADDDGVLNPANIDLTPGTIITKAVGSAGLKPLEMPGRFDVSQLLLSDLRARIRHALLVDRLAPIEGPRMTATEVLTRSAEISLLLGAIYGRLQSELLTPLLGQIHAILRHRGEVPDLPLDGRTLSLSFRSPLARAQAQSGVQAVLGWLEGVAKLGPHATAAVDGVAVARHLADTLGMPETFLTPESATGAHE